MLEEPRFAPASPRYRETGLIANPFRSAFADSALDASAQVICHAEALRLMAALDAEADRERARPVWVTKSEDIPDFYTRIPLSETISTLSVSDELNLLGAYVPFFMMRHGKIRCALEMIAEKLAGQDFALTAACFARAALGDPDPELLESAGLSRSEAEELAARFAASPREMSAEVFGADVPTRESGPAVEEIVGDGALRMGKLETDPETDGEEAAADLQDPAEASCSDEEPCHSEAPCLTYLKTYARKHISPVMARGLDAYIEGGSYALAQELKITKAPRKTLAALGRFATYRFRKVVIVYDQFASWPLVPEDLRVRIAGALAEIRMLLSKTGILVFLADDHELPEIKEQFSGAREVFWSMAPLLEEVSGESSVPSGLVSFALGAASLTGEIPLQLQDIEGDAQPADAGFIGRLGAIVDKLAGADEPADAGEPAGANEPAGAEAAGVASGQEDTCLA